MINIEIKGRKYTLEEAAELYMELKQIFGEKETVYIPYVPTYPTSPWYEITCTSGTGFDEWREEMKKITLADNVQISSDGKEWF